MTLTLWEGCSQMVTRGRSDEGQTALEVGTKVLSWGVALRD